MIVDVSKASAKKAAAYFYNYHVAQIKKLPENYATASKHERAKIEHHEKAALLYLWTLKDLR